MNEDRSIWWWVLFGAALLAAAVGGYLWWKRSGTPPAAAPVAEAPSAPPATQAPPATPAAPPAAPPETPVHPIEPPPAVEAEPLPTLENSDSAMRAGLASLFGTARINESLVMQGIIGRVVATIDNLPREKATTRLWPVKPVGGLFQIEGEGDARRVAAANAERYKPFMAALRTVDAGKLAALYVRQYPLFQQAYRELGYPKGHFNDRLVQVIDHLLAAPEVDAAALTQPKVLYEYADPQLESRSAGQKVLMRIGAENAREVKRKLREIRAAVATAKPQN